MPTEKDENESHIGSRIASARKKAGFAKAQALVDKIDDKSVSISVLQNLESGRKRDILVSQLVLIADAVGVSIDELLGGTAGLQAAYSAQQRERGEFQRVLHNYVIALANVAYAADKSADLRPIDVQWLEEELRHQTPAMMTLDALVALEALTARSGGSQAESGKYLGLLHDLIESDQNVLEKRYSGSTDG